MAGEIPDISPEELVKKPTDPTKDFDNPGVGPVRQLGENELGPAELKARERPSQEVIDLYASRGLDLIQEKGLYFFYDKAKKRKIPATMGGGSGTIADPTAAENVPVLATLELAVEDRLRPLEAGGAITDLQLRDFIKTINEQLTAATPAEKAMLVERVQARVKYHNLALKAQRNAKEYGAEFKGISNREHEVIFNTPGVREALNGIENGIPGVAGAPPILGGNGEFFRLDNVTAAAHAGPGGTLETMLTTPGPMGLGLNAQDAQTAIQLAIKAAHIFGDSAYYDGIRTMGGAPVLLTGSGVTPPGPGAVTPRPTAADRYGEFIEDQNNWNSANPNRIDFANSLEGQGANALKDILYLPIRLQKDGIGRAGLRRFAYLGIALGDYRSNNPAGFVNAAAIAGVAGGPIDTAAIRATNDWAGQIASAGENGEKLWKGGDAVLEAPLMGANNVTTDNMRSALPDVLKTYEAAAPAYAHLPRQERERAMARLLVNLLGYLNDGRASRRDGLHYLGWNSAIINEALNIEMEKGLITRQGAAFVRQELDASRLNATGSIFRNEMGKASGSYIKGVLGAIFGAAGKR